MNTYNDLCNKILNEYQITQNPTPQNPIVNNLISYLQKSGIDVSNIKPEDMETILNNNELEDDQNKTEPEAANQNGSNTQVKSNVVSNVPVVNNTTSQNKILQKNNIVR
jgi:hypothetical protein